MKKNIFGWLLISAAAFTLGACSQDVDILSNDSEIAKDGKKVFNFEATLDLDAETRTTFSDDYRQLVWTEGDRLSFSTDAGDVNVASSKYAGGNTYSASLSADATTVYAFYPYENVTPIGGYYLNVTVPSNQVQQKAGKLNGANVPMYAVASLDGDNTTLRFNPFVTIIAFNVYNSNGANGEKLTSILVGDQTFGANKNPHSDRAKCGK